MFSICLLNVFFSVPLRLHYFQLVQILENDLYLEERLPCSPRTSVLLMPIDQDVWPHCTVVKDSLWATISDLNLGNIGPPEEDEVAYHTPFGDNKEGGSIFISPRSSLRMRVEKADAAWSAIRFDLNLGS